MDKKQTGTMGRKVLEMGMHDAVVDGALHTDIPTRVIFVTDTTERDALEDLEPGTFVALYGLAHV